MEPQENVRRPPIFPGIAPLGMSGGDNRAPTPPDGMSPSPATPACPSPIGCGLPVVCLAPAANAGTPPASAVRRDSLCALVACNAPLPAASYRPASTGPCIVTPVGLGAAPLSWPSSVGHESPVLCRAGRCAGGAPRGPSRSVACRC